jgi:hypothetical protein
VRAIERSVHREMRDRLGVFRRAMGVEPFERARAKGYAMSSERAASYSLGGDEQQARYRATRTRAVEG